MSTFIPMKKSKKEEEEMDNFEDLKDLLNTKPLPYWRDDELGKKIKVPDKVIEFNKRLKEAKLPPDYFDNLFK